MAYGVILCSSLEKVEPSAILKIDITSFINAKTILLTTYIYGVASCRHKLVNQHTTALFILPNSNLIYYMLNSIVLPIGFVFRWGASTMLLRNFYQRMVKLPLSFWIVLSLPLIFYLVGKMPGFIGV